MDDNKKSAPCKAVTELIQSKTQTFYSVINNNMVYVTITVQKLPQKVMGMKNDSGHQTVKEYINSLTERLDYLDIGHLIV